MPINTNILDPMQFKLSICIPTFNRSYYLNQLIRSILLQNNDNIEIVISDNASTDETMSLIRGFQANHNNISYFRCDSNVGADRNLLRAVSVARGEYCWLMGSDDVVEPFAVQAVLSILGQHANLAGMSVNLNIYTRELVLQKNAVSVAGGKLTVDRLFHDRDECFTRLGLYFGFFSGQIINKRLWADTIANSEVHRHCTGFILVYIIGLMLKANPEWYFLSARCVGNRTGNDSILDEVGFYQRQVIAHKEFERTISALFPKNSAVYRNVLKLALSTYIVRDCVGYKADGIDVFTLWKLTKLYTKIYKSFIFYWRAIFPIIISPRWAIKELRRVFGMVMRWNRGV